ncbi:MULTISPECIES: hypothetical protein [unclassified Peribacillus]|uniref:hypothetical protein n=1 Tax=unclassified Peribacillus TaxID=2675266 RepID=UPI00366F91F4
MNDKSPQFICTDCVFVFLLLTPIGRGYRKFCPKCGDFVSVQKFETKVKKKKRQIWSDEELSYIDRCIAGEILTYQLATKLGRTPQSIKRRKQRRIAELAMKS